MSFTPFLPNSDTFLLICMVGSSESLHSLQAKWSTVNQLTAMLMCILISTAQNTLQFHLDTFSNRIGTIFLRCTSNFLWHQNNAHNRLVKRTQGLSMAAQVCNMSNDKAETSQVAHVFNLNTRGLEAGRSLWVGGQSGLNFRTARPTQWDPVSNKQTNKLRQEDWHKFEANWSYRVKHSLKKKIDK